MRSEFYWWRQRIAGNVHLRGYVRLNPIEGYRGNSILDFFDRGAQCRLQLGVSLFVLR